MHTSRIVEPVCVCACECVYRTTFEKKNNLQPRYLTRCFIYSLHRIWVTFVGQYHRSKFTVIGAKNIRGRKQLFPPANVFATNYLIIRLRMPIMHVNGRDKSGFESETVNK